MSQSTAVRGYLYGLLAFVLGVVLVVLFFLVDRDGAISGLIQRLGALGVGVSILLMALFCVIPVPSEFLMVLNMRVYGVWWGIFYSWFGAMLGAIAVFHIARSTGRGLVERFVAKERVHQVEAWIGRRGVAGLLLARLVPLPFIVVNYAAGVFRSVRVGHYIWTTGVGIMPYDVGAAFVYLGVSRRYVEWLIVGGVVVALLWAGGLWLKRRSHADGAVTSRKAMRWK